MERIMNIALIPAYQPSDLLPELVRELYANDFITVVVDDGSGEKYSGIFEKASEYAEILTHLVNKGKGRALKTGLAYILNKYPGDAVTVTLDADGQHKISDAVKVCAAAADSPGIVLGCRIFGKETPSRSRFGNEVTRFVYRISTGISVSDTQTGLRAYKVNMIPFLLTVPGERYEYEMNMILKCAEDHIRMDEVKIQTVYFDNNSESHFNTNRTALEPVHYRKLADHRYRGQCNEGAEFQSNMLESIDFTPKIGMNTYMLEFDIPRSYYDKYYLHKGSTVRRPEPITDEVILQWKRQCEVEIQKRGLHFHDMGHGWTAEPFGL